MIRAKQLAEQHRLLTQRMLALLKERPTGATSFALSELTGVGRSTISRSMTELEEAGSIVVVKEPTGSGGLHRHRYVHIDHAPEKVARSKPTPKPAPPPKVKAAAPTTTPTERQALLAEARVILSTQALVQALHPGGLDDDQIELVILRLGAAALRGLVKP